jgi:two-component system response regulator YesN
VIDITGMIIADDELLIRQGLQSIAWGDFGIEVRGVAANGMEALAFVRSTDSKILLTDVRMPGMDGLKLIDAAKAIVPDIKAILLTGYQDFSYAQTAIHLGAFGYILKPSNPDEIIRAVVKARDQIETERAEKDVLLNSFLLDLIYGRIPDSPAIVGKCGEFGLRLENFVIMVAEFGFKYGETDGNLMPRIKKETYEVLSDAGKVNILDTDRSTFCIIAELDAGGQPAREKMLSAARELKDHLGSMFDIYVTIGVSRCFSGPAHMYSAYNQAVNCLKMKFSLGRGAIIHIEDLVDSFNRQRTLPMKLVDEIVEKVADGDCQEAESLIRELLYRLSKEQKTDEQMIKIICYDILASSMRILREKGFTGDLEEKERLFHSMLTGCSDAGELEEFLINAVLEIMNFIHSGAPAVKNKVIKNILDYIEKYYMNDISLLTVSEFVHMNHIYLSRLIKKETGKTFLDILTRTRMEKACEMLKDGSMKAYEVAELVGLRDSGYFSQVFKKYFGMTPSEYRESDLRKRGRL